MRTLNSRDIDAAESEHIALVKRCGCVFCPYRGPTEAHHPKGCQGLHRCTVSVCPECHSARVWTFCGMTEMQALNETHRRADLLRNGKPIPNDAPIYSRQHSTRAPIDRKRGKHTSASKKTLKNRYATARREA